MGRPLPKKFFGNPTTGGNQIVVQADLGAGVVSGWIIRQKGTRTFDITDGAVTLRCRLVETITGPGQATIEVIPETGPNETARTLLKNRVKTNQGSDKPWKFTSPSNGYVQIQNS
jgi:hypothetical protein